MKHNKLFNWLFSLFMLLPMLAIGVKCLYVSFNKNANQSYYGETINEVISVNVDSDNFGINKNYHLLINSNINITSQPPTWQITNFEPIAFSDSNALATLQANKDSIDAIYFGNNNTNIYANGVSILAFAADYRSGEFSFTLLNGSYNQQLATNLTLETYNKNSYLDNAFYYAIDEFNQCGFNKVDFVGWFDFFHTKNNIYIEFANTYINYMLFVTLAFFIPRVLMWFVGYAYGLTDSWSGRSKLW